MPGELFEIEGEKKKRVVRAHLFYFLSVLEFVISPRLPHILQCYFFDSDVGGFHYGPGHPYVAVLGDNDDILNHVLVFVVVQHEAHSDSHVSFSSNELRAVQEDGDICK
jgi:hypothetical protein